eukprot:4450970-Pleurochrysis_carterae.AAC.1
MKDPLWRAMASLSKSRPCSQTAPAEELVAFEANVWLPKPDGSVQQSGPAMQRAKKQRALRKLERAQGAHKGLVPFKCITKAMYGAWEQDRQ